MRAENIIIGGGLAGTILAWQFYFQNKDFILIDDNPDNSSSKVAAGLYNPIVFKRLTQSWKADKLLPYLDEFYSKIEYELNCKLHTKRNILRLIPSIEDKKLWEKKSADDNLKNFLVQEIQSNPFPEFVLAPHGVGVVKDAGNLNVNKFLKLSHKYFKDKNKYIENKVAINPEELSQLKSKYNAKRIIFAEGWLNTKNNYFNWIPYKLVKGEIFKLEIPGLDTKDVPNKRVFLLPVGDNEFIAGSTYRWSFDDDKPTQDEGNYLKNHLDNILKCNYKILEHKAGIRPAILDRRPVIGSPPGLEDFYIFNGMGSKSVMLAPYLSQELVDSIYFEKLIDSEVSVSRFEKYFTRQKSLSAS